MRCRKSYILSFARSPIGDFLGSLRSMGAVDLGILVAREAMKRAKVDPESVQEVATGIVLKSGLKGNPSRQIQLGCGIPVEKPAYTVEQQCASGLKAVEMIAAKIELGEIEVGLAIGVESMSNAPHLLGVGRGGQKMGDITLHDSILRDSLHDAFDGKHMAITAERLATKYSISRREQDQLALLSHQRALQAQEKGLFDEEIVPVEARLSKNETTIVKQDEHPRRDTSLEKLAKLQPVFMEGGTVTAGNSSAMSDGAAAMVLVSEDFARKSAAKPLARLLSVTSRGVSPEIMGIGPAYAIPEAIRQAGLEKKQISYYEINEAFAAIVLAVIKELRISLDIVNRVGSGISLGHPLGCTGTRILGTLLYELRRSGETYGCASLCAGGGPAMAAVVERA